MFEPLKIVRVITEEVGTPRNDGTPGSALYRVPLELSSVPPPSWSRVFVEAFDNPRSYTSMHQPGIASVSGKKIILRDTTLEWVGGTHKPVLEAAVERANAEVEAQQARASVEARRKAAAEDEHRRRVAEEAAKIKF